MAEYISPLIARLRGKLAEHSHGGVVLSSEDVDGMVRALRDIETNAKALEHEVSRHRWNIKARAEREARELLTAAIMDPDRKVVMFPDRRDRQSGGGDAA